MRTPQPEGHRGSLKWLQLAVEHTPHLLKPESLPDIEWLSPLRDDDFSEYSDTSALDLLGLNDIAPQLADFWPRRGPQWDALGRSETSVILVEAKAHIREFLTSPSQAGEFSRKKLTVRFL